MRFGAVCLALIVAVQSLKAAEPALKPPITQGQRVFTAGHSFHYWIPPILSEMAAAAGIKDHQVAGVSSIGGSMVIQHWNVPNDPFKLKEALTAGKVDVLTLSPIWLPDEGIEKLAKLAFEHNPNVRVMVQEFWLPNDRYHPVYPLEYMTGVKVDHNAATFAELKQQQDLYDQSMDDHIRGLNKQLGKEVLFTVPVGQAVVALREKVIAGQAPGIKTQKELFADDWGHAMQHIQVLAAYCYFAAIYRQNPLGLPVPAELAALNLPPDEAKALNRLLQELAWDAVIHHPLSGIQAG